LLVGGGDWYGRGHWFKALFFLTVISADTALAVDRLIGFRRTEQNDAISVSNAAFLRGEGTELDAANLIFRYPTRK
jgi:hypothetical protein